MTEIREAAMKFEAEYRAFKKNSVSNDVTFRIHPNDTPIDLLALSPGTRLMIAAVVLDDEDRPVQTKTTRDSERAFASAHMLLGDPQFRIWCAAEFRCEDDEETVKAALLKAIGAEGFTEIRNNRKVMSAFIDLRSQFNQDFERNFS